MSHRRRMLFGVLAGAMSYGLFCSAGFGQVGPDRPRQATDSDDAGTIEEIIVTATRRVSALQDTALSVGVLTDGTIDEAGLRDFDDYWRRIPSMSVTDSGPFGTRVAVRGLSANTSARSDEALAAVYLDDTPLTPPEGFYTSPPDVYLVDVDRIEVLRGPQGTLFGASSMGGAVRTITRRPDPSATTQSYEATVSNTRRGDLNYDLNATWNLPIVEGRSAVRLAAWYRDLDGYIDDIGLGVSNVNRSRTSGFRLSASARVGERLSVTARVQLQDADKGSFNEVDPNGKPEIGLATRGDYELALLVDEFRDDAFELYNLELTYSAASADWVSVTSFVKNRADYTIDISDEMNTFFGEYLAVPIDGFYDQEAFTQELRVASSGDGVLGWQGGLFYLDQEVPRFDIGPAPGFNNSTFCVDVDPPPPAGAPFPTCTGLPDGEEILFIEPATATREDYGVFGELSYRFGERWDATVGARWYQVEKTLVATSSGFFIGGFDIPTDIASDEDGVNAKGSLSYRINEDAMVYALASQGFRPGGGNDSSILGVCTEAPAQYESDSLWNYELGAKTAWLDNRITLNGAIYRIDWSDAQIVVFSPECVTSYIDNVGQATSDGLELELAARINDAWDLSLATGFTDAKLTETLPNIEIDAPAGTELPNVPEMTASLATSWRFAAFRQPGYLRADAQHVGASYSEIDRNRRIRKPSYTLVNLGLGVDFHGWRTELFVDNLLDEQAMLYCCRLNGEFVVNRPRTVGLRASYGR